MPQAKPPRPMLLLIRAVIILAYGMFASPLVLFALMGNYFWLLVAAGFAVWAIAAFPQARRDWNC